MATKIIKLTRRILIVDVQQNEIMTLSLSLLSGCRVAGVAVVKIYLAEHLRFHSWVGEAVRHVIVNSYIISGSY